MCLLQVSVDVAVPGEPAATRAVLRAAASAVAFPGFLAAYAPEHFRGRGAAADDADGEAADGGGGGKRGADEATEGEGGGSGAATVSTDQALFATLSGLKARWRLGLAEALYCMASDRC